MTGVVFAGMFRRLRTFSPIARLLLSREDLPGITVVGSKLRPGFVIFSDLEGFQAPGSGWCNPTEYFDDDVAP